MVGQATDVFFAGKDKERLKTLLELKEEFTRHGIKTEFLIFPERGKKYTESEKVHMVFKGQRWWEYLIPYEAILEGDLRSKAILDIVQEGQTGLTWRPIEALLLERKLITNFVGIKEYDFYSKENIFILGEDDMSLLVHFLNSPYSKVSEKVKQRYTFSGMVAEVYAAMGWTNNPLT